jgi:hypothetical protein
MFMDILLFSLAQQSKSGLRTLVLGFPGKDKNKGKIHPKQTTKAQRVSRGIALLFL